MTKRVINTEAFLEYLKHWSSWYGDHMKKSADKGEYTEAMEYKCDQELYDYLIWLIEKADESESPSWIDVIDENGATCLEDDLK